MKRLLLIIALCAVSLAGCKKYDAEIADLQRQIDELTTANSKVNDNVQALGLLVEALQNAAEVTSFSKIVQNGKVVGYTVTFKEEGKPAETVTVYNSPANVSVGELDGKYYWMVGGAWLTDDNGNKIEACTSAVVPQFRIVSGIIEASLDGGTSWKSVGEVGVPVVNDLIDGDDAVTIVLAGGGRITIQKQRELTLTLSAYSLSMAAGGGRSISYEISGGSENTEIILYARDGWTATSSATDAARGTIEILSPETVGKSEILVFVSDDGRSVVTSVSVESK